ncbi:MAG: MFS transporter [Tessaracoccus sp.]
MSQRFAENAAVQSATASAVQRRTLIVLVIMQVVGTVGVGVAPSIGILLASEVTDNEAWAGLARTASTLGAALFGLPLGNLAARLGRRFALAIGWWVAAVGSAILVAAAQGNMVGPLFIGLLLIGAGSAAALQSRFAATDLAEPQHKARSLALVVWVGTLGSVLGPNLGAPGEIVGAATGLTVFASAFLIAAICLALAGVLVFVLLRPDPLVMAAQLSGAPPHAASRKGRIRRIFAEVRANRPARIAVIAILTAQIVMVAVMTMTPVHIVHHGGSVNVVGITISLHVVGMYALSPVVGWMADRYGHRLAMWIGIVIFVLSLLAGAIWPDDMGWIVVSLILLGVGWSFVNVAGSALFSTSVSAEVRASSQGGVDALSNLFGATAAFLAGPLLAVSSFATLSLLSMTVLVPLAALIVRPLVRPSA